MSENNSNTNPIPALSKPLLGDCASINKSLEDQIRPHAQYWNCYNDCSLEYNHTGKLIKITENFAIEFGKWLLRNFNNYGPSDEKELLQIFKKEKGL